MGARQCVRQSLYILILMRLLRSLHSLAKTLRHSLGCLNDAIGLPYPPPAEVSRSDGGGHCRDCSPSSPKRRVWETRPSMNITATLTRPPSASGGHYDTVSNAWAYLGHRRLPQSVAADLRRPLLAAPLSSLI